MSRRKYLYRLNLKFLRILVVDSDHTQLALLLIIKKHLKTVKLNNI